MKNEASDIKLDSLYSTIKMMHGPINISIAVGLPEDEDLMSKHEKGNLHRCTGTEALYRPCGP